jgi:CubicO group peptidase (beta-lactamase class C family)
VRLEGTTAKELEPVGDAFAGVLRAQAGTGAAVAIWRDGEFVVDLWGGTADAAGHPWRRDSIVQPYSVSKPFAALPALLLVDRGLLDLDVPARKYWPELHAAATVRELLSHQGGVVALDEPTDVTAFYDWDRMCALLAGQEPAWPPGTGHGESACSTGTSSASWSAASTAAHPGASCARRCAARSGWTSPSGSPPPSRPGRWS